MRVGRPFPSSEFVKGKFSEKPKNTESVIVWQRVYAVVVHHGKWKMGENK